MFTVLDSTLLLPDCSRLPGFKIITEPRSLEDFPCRGRDKYLDAGGKTDAAAPNSKKFFRPSNALRAGLNPSPSRLLGRFVGQGRVRDKDECIELVIRKY
jgi:hypothetical protein